MPHPFFTPPPTPGESSPLRAQDLFRDRRKVAGLLLILGTMGSILAWGLTQQNDIGQLALFDQSISVGSSAESQGDRLPLRSPLMAGVPADPQGREQTSVTVPPDRVPDSVPDRAPDRAIAPTAPGAIAVAPPAIGGFPGTDLTATLEADPAAPPPLDISDVPRTHWAYPFILALHQQQILPDFPNGTFNPDQPVTRAELAAQIQRAFQIAPTESPLRFPDVPANSWAAPAIDQAVQMGFMQGYAEGTFRPEQRVPRYQVLVALASGLELSNSVQVNLSQRFGDADQLPPWAVPQVSAATQAALVVSPESPAQLNPQQPATRAEVAVMIHQALVSSGRLPAIASNALVQP